MRLAYIKERLTAGISPPIKAMGFPKCQNSMNTVMKNAAMRNALVRGPGIGAPQPWRWLTALPCVMVVGMALLMLSGCSRVEAVQGNKENLVTENLVTNGSFEEGGDAPSAWSLAGDASWKEPGRSGRKAVGLQAKAGGKAEVYSAFYHLPEKTRFLHIAGWLKAAAIDDFDVSYNAALEVEFLNGQHQLLRREMVGFVHGTTDWVQRERTVPAPADTVFFRINFHLNKTLRGVGYLDDVMVKSSEAPAEAAEKIQIKIVAERTPPQSGAASSAGSGKFVLSNIFGDKLDSRLTFRVSTHYREAEDARHAPTITAAVLDHEDVLLCQAIVSPPLPDQEKHVWTFVVEAPRGGLPLEQYLRLVVRVLDKGGQPLASRSLPFGIFSQDGDVADFPLPRAISRPRQDSPFGVFARTQGQDRDLPGFGTKDLYAARLTGADWIRSGYAWLQEKPGAAIGDGSPPFGSWLLPSWMERYHYAVLPLIGQGYPAWATTDNVSTHATGTNIADRQALASFVRDAHRRMADKTRFFQFFNEPEFRSPEQIENHLQAMAVVYREVKALDPTIQVVSAGFNSGIAPLETYLKADLGKYVDIIDVHNYATSLEQMEEWMQQQVRLVNEYAPGKKLWCTEFAPRWTSRMEPDGVADWLIKSYVIGMRHGFEKMFWFGYRPRAFHDWDAALIEEDDSATPRPAFFAYRVLTRKLAGKRFIRELPAQQAVRVFLFQGESKAPMIILWRTSPTAAPLRLQVGRAQEKYNVTDYLGKAITQAAQGGVIELAARHPIFLEGDIAVESFSALPAVVSP